ncbi:MAG TPA: hypothetical protein PKA63_05745 [Oligoflexia bacterium]|nr:hypothetical protein [Oligoflexia bacterium]HMP48153.1 hypothetical protein [Oligoflexia bacterium]
MLKKFFPIIGSLIVSVLFSELMIRIFLPVIKVLPDNPRHGAYGMPDPEIGWIHKPGRHEFIRDGDDKKFTMTFDNNGARIIPGSLQAKNSAVLVGCSFTEGYFLDDSETFASFLEKEIPDYNFINYGVGGYGTYQSLLILKRILPKISPPPRIIIYGFIAHHIVRNVGDPNYRFLLSSLSPEGDIPMPYCKPFNKEKSEYICVPPELFFPTAISRSFLQIVKQIGTMPYFYPRKTTLEQSKNITKDLIIKMKNESTKVGAEFIIFLASSPKEISEELFDMAKNNNISIIDCQHPKQNDPEYLIPGDGHPNEKITEYWAKCFAEKLSGKYGFSSS